MLGRPTAIFHQLCEVRLTSALFPVAGKLSPSGVIQEASHLNPSCETGNGPAFINECTKSNAK